VGLVLDSEVDEWEGDVEVVVFVVATRVDGIAGVVTCVSLVPDEGGNSWGL